MFLSDSDNELAPLSSELDSESEYSDCSLDEDYIPSGHARGSNKWVPTLRAGFSPKNCPCLRYMWRVGHTHCRGHGHPKVISRTGTPVHCSAVLVCTGCPFVPALSRHRLANLQQSRRGHVDITHCACTLFDMKVSFMHRSRRTAAVISACSQGTGRVHNATPYNSNHI